MTHDKAGDFFLIWATQLFWLSHQWNKGFMGGLVTTLLPGQLSENNLYTRKLKGRKTLENLEMICVLRLLI